MFCFGHNEKGWSSSQVAHPPTPALPFNGINSGDRPQYYELPSTAAPEASGSLSEQVKTGGWVAHPFLLRTRCITIERLILLEQITPELSLRFCRWPTLCPAFGGEGGVGLSYCRSRKISGKRISNLKLEISDL